MNWLRGDEPQRFAQIHIQEYLMDAHWYYTTHVKNPLPVEYLDEVFEWSLVGTLADIQGNVIGAFG